MGLFDLKLWRLLASARTVTTVDSIQQQGPSVGAINDAPLRDEVTLTNPGTTYGTILDVTGKGYLLALKIDKPTTSNSVHVQLRITVDGTAIASDAAMSNSVTQAIDRVIVGQAQYADSNAPLALPPVLLPFNTSLKIEAKYSGTPGGSENITAHVLAVYN